MTWAVKWRSECLLDGKTEYLLGAKSIPPMLYKTRTDARAFIKERYAYLRKRPDLQREPHGWKMPVAVKVAVRIEEI